MSKKKHATTTTADLVLVHAEWEEAFAHLETTRKSLRTWHRRFPAFEPDLDYNAFRLADQMKELERAMHWYRSVFDAAKLRGLSDATSADEDNPFS